MNLVRMPDSRLIDMQNEQQTLLPVHSATPTNQKYIFCQYAQNTKR